MSTDPTAPNREQFEQGCSTLPREQLVELAYKWRLQLHRLQANARSVTTDLGENIARTLENEQHLLAPHVQQGVTDVVDVIRAGDVIEARKTALRLQTLLDHVELPEGISHAGIVSHYMLVGKVAMFLAVTTGAE